MLREAGTCGISTQLEPWLTVAERLQARLSQQCLHARLQSTPGRGGDVGAEWVEVTLAPQLWLSCGAQGRFSPRCPGDSYPAVTLTQPPGAWQVVRSALDSWPVLPVLPLVPPPGLAFLLSLASLARHFSLGLPGRLRGTPG